MKTVIVVLLITILYMCLSVDAQCWCRGHQCLDNEVQMSTCEGPYDSKPYCCLRNPPPPPDAVRVRRCSCRLQCHSDEVEMTNDCVGVFDNKPYCCER